MSSCHLPVVGRFVLRRVRDVRLLGRWSKNTDDGGLVLKFVSRRLVSGGLRRLQYLRNQSGQTGPLLTPKMNPAASNNLELNVILIAFYPAP